MWIANLLRKKKAVIIQEEIDGGQSCQGLVGAERAEEAVYEATKRRGLTVVKIVNARGEVLYEKTKGGKNE